MSNVKIGDYVLASKYRDGYPLDHFAVGYLTRIWSKDSGDVRYDVVDGDGQLFRGNGFRRVERVSPARGRWLVLLMPTIESLARAGSKRTVWGWKRLPMRAYNV